MLPAISEEDEKSGFMPIGRNRGASSTKSQTVVAYFVDTTSDGHLFVRNMPDTGTVPKPDSGYVQMFILRSGDSSVTQPLKKLLPYQFVVENKPPMFEQGLPSSKDVYSDSRALIVPSSLKIFKGRDGLPFIRGHFSFAADRARFTPSDVLELDRRSSYLPREFSRTHIKSNVSPEVELYVRCFAKQSPTGYFSAIFGDQRPVLSTQCVAVRAADGLHHDLVQEISINESCCVLFGADEHVSKLTVTPLDIINNMAILSTTSSADFVDSLEKLFTEKYGDIERVQKLKPRLKENSILFFPGRIPEFHYQQAEILAIMLQPNVQVKMILLGGEMSNSAPAGSFLMINPDIISYKKVHSVSVADALVPVSNFMDQSDKASDKGLMNLRRLAIARFFDLSNSGDLEARMLPACTTFNVKSIVAESGCDTDAEEQRCFRSFYVKVLWHSDRLLCQALIEKSITRFAPMRRSRSGRWRTFLVSLSVGQDLDFLKNCPYVRYPGRPSESDR